MALKSHLSPLYDSTSRLLTSGSPYHKIGAVYKSAETNSYFIFLDISSTECNGLMFQFFGALHCG